MQRGHELVFARFRAFTHSVVRALTIWPMNMAVCTAPCALEMAKMRPSTHQGTESGVQGSLERSGSAQ